MKSFRNRVITVSVFFVGLIVASVMMNGCSNSSSATAPTSTFYGAGQ